MEYRRKSPYQCTAAELDRELIARGNRIPTDRRFGFTDREGTPARDDIMGQINEFYCQAASLSSDPALRHVSTWELTEALVYMTEGVKLDDTRAISGNDDRRDIFQLEDKPTEAPVRKNADSVAAICMKEDLIRHNNRSSTLKHKNFGKTFNLCRCEPFYRQPVAAGHLFTGFLVDEDVIATAGHCVDENNVTDTRILFGYKMKDPAAPVTRVPNQDIYKGTKIIRGCFERTGNRSDWALVKLDRKVTGRRVVKLSQTDIPGYPPVYVIGHPCGLPLKYAAGAQVLKIENAFLVADLDIYAGNSGSPVFDKNTHEVIGMVVRGDNRDFRWTGGCYITVIRPSPAANPEKAAHTALPGTSGAECTRVSEFIAYCINPHSRNITKGSGICRKK